MVKKFNRYTVNVIVPVNFQIQVLASDEDEAISLCEDKLDPQYVFENYSNDTCGIDVPWDTYDDDDDTPKFELVDINLWDSARYELDEWEKPFEEELTFSDVDDEEENDDEEEV